MMCARVCGSSRPPCSSAAVVICGDRRHRRQEQHVREVVVLRGNDRRVVEDGRDQDNAVAGDPALCEDVDQVRRARRPVALADEELRTVPAVGDRQVSLDERREGAGVLIDPIDGLGVVGAAVAGPRRVDEDKVSDVEQAVVVVDQTIGRGRCGRRVRGNDAPGAEGAQMQPHGRRAGAAVVDERDRVMAVVGAIVARVGDVRHRGDRLAVAPANDQDSGARRIGDVRSGDVDVVMGDDRRLGGQRRTRRRCRVGGDGEGWDRRGRSQRKESEKKRPKSLHIGVLRHVRHSGPACAGGPHPAHREVACQL